MEEYDKIDFAVDFNDLPDNEEELAKDMTKEEKAQLSAPNNEIEELTQATSTNPGTVFEKLYGHKDSPTLTMTQREIGEGMFHSQFFVKSLSPEQQKEVSQFISHAVPHNGKFFIRDELLTLAKNMLAVLSA